MFSRKFSTFSKRTRAAHSTSKLLGVRIYQTREGTHEHEREFLRFSRHLGNCCVASVLKHKIMEYVDDTCHRETTEFNTGMGSSSNNPNQ